MSGTDALPRKRSQTLYRVFFWCGEFIVMLGFWFLLTGKANFSEFAAGALSIIVSLIAVHICVEEPFTHFRKYARYILQIWRIPASVATGLFQVSYALAQQLLTRNGAPSRIQKAAFHFGRDDDPVDQLRRTLALTYPCCSPNFVALEIDSKKDVYIFHQVKPTPPPKLVTVFDAPTKDRRGESP